MGPPEPGSRLARLEEAQRLLIELVIDGPYTTRQIAGATGLGERQLSRWRQGKQAPSPEQLEKLRSLKRKSGISASGHLP